MFWRTSQHPPLSTSRGLPFTHPRPNTPIPLSSGAEGRGHRPVAVLHFIPEDLPDILARYRAALAPGRIIALTHASDDLDDPEVAAAIRAGAEAYRASAIPMTLRTRAQVHALLDGLEVAEPGLVDLTDWPVPVPDPDTSPAGGWAAISRVP